jgi:hypothetical protein
MVSQHIDSYIPRGAGTAWWRVAGEVRRVVKLAEPSTPYTATQLLGPLAKLAMFADAEGRSRDAVTWLSLEMIERFIAVGCPGLGGSTQANYRARLRRLRTTVLGPDTATGLPARLGGSTASAPYTTAAMTALWSWGYGQPTERQRTGCKTLLALGRGCGLDSAEALQVRRQDIHPDGDSGRSRSRSPAHGPGSSSVAAPGSRCCARSSPPTRPTAGCSGLMRTSGAKHGHELPRRDAS